MIVDISGHLIDIFMDGCGFTPVKTAAERAAAQKRYLDAVARDARNLENRYMTDSGFALWLDHLMNDMGTTPYPMSMALSDADATSLEYEYLENPDNPWVVADRAKQYLAAA